jgi:hypothetical protein
LSQAELAQDLSRESSFELSSDPKYQQSNVVKNDDSLEKKPLAAATAVDEESIV